jgi:hypothetical protein
MAAAPPHIGIASLVDKATVPAALAANSVVETAKKARSEVMSPDKMGDGRHGRE